MAKDLTEMVRARTATGRNISVPRGVVDASDDLTLIDDEPVSQVHGRVTAETRASGRPAVKPHTSVAKSAAEKAVTEPAANNKETDQ